MLFRPIPGSVSIYCAVVRHCLLFLVAVVPAVESSFYYSVLRVRSRA